jgi:iron-regulated transporter 1
MSPHLGGGSPHHLHSLLLYRRPSVIDFEEEKRAFGPGLEVLEPRPHVHCVGLFETLDQGVIEGS